MGPAGPGPGARRTPLSSTTWPSNDLAPHVLVAFFLVSSRLLLPAGASSQTSLHSLGFLVVLAGSLRKQDFVGRPTLLLLAGAEDSEVLGPQGAPVPG